MQICNYTPAQDLDRLVAMSHQNTGMLCCFDGYQNSFHFLLDFFFSPKYICMHFCVSVYLPSWSVSLSESQLN